MDDGKMRNLRLRSELFRAIRDCFYRAGYLEVETPVKIHAPAPEEYIESVRAEKDFLLPSAAPGAFILVGVILALKNYASYRKAVKAGRLYVPPKGLDCRHCNICTAHIDDEK